METQICFKCGIEKPLSEFYEHPQMTNGHLGKCKDCTKTDVRTYSKTEKGKNTEKRRNAKLGRMEHLKNAADKWNKEHPDRYTAHNRLHAAVRDGKINKPKNCQECGASGIIHGHHEDYSKPFEVLWLCVPCHGKRHPKYIG
jgi:hypothetical protein